MLYLASYLCSGYVLHRRLGRCRRSGIAVVTPPPEASHQRRALKPPKEVKDSSSSSSSSSHLRFVVSWLSHGGEVSADWNCLFKASRKVMGLEEVDASELWRRTVSRFSEDLRSVRFVEKEAIDDAIRHMYSLDLKNGWGIHVIQEVKLLAKKEDLLLIRLQLSLMEL